MQRGFSIVHGTASFNSQKIPHEEHARKKESDHSSLLLSRCMMERSSYGTEHDLGAGNYFSVVMLIQ
jgi:hypothetical protein